MPMPDGDGGVVHHAISGLCDPKTEISILAAIREIVIKSTELVEKRGSRHQEKAGTEIHIPDEGRFRVERKMVVPIERGGAITPDDATGFAQLAMRTDYPCSDCTNLRT